MKRIVVLDVDDVIFDLNGAVERAVAKDYPSFSFKNARTYNLNSTLSEDQKISEGIDLSDEWNGLGAPKRCIINKYASVESYKESKMYHLPRLAELCRKCEVIFHTAGSTVDVCKYKVEQLNALLDSLGVTAGISVQMVCNMTLVDLGNGDVEAVAERASIPKPAILCDYVVEDSIENLSGYLDCVTILVDKPYNQAKFYKNMEGAVSLRVQSTNDAIDYILDEVG